MTAWLKADVSRLRPEFRFAFSRPGLVTWKMPAPVTAMANAPAVPSLGPFARVAGFSLGRAETGAAAAALIAESIRGAGPRGRAHVHVFMRPCAGDVDVQVLASQATRVTAASRDLHAALGDRVASRGETRPGDVVFDVVLPPEDESPGEWFVGVHIHGPWSSPTPGGPRAVVSPDDAPSRAYAKIEEAIAWGGIPVRRGDVALELGAAPGGACLALLHRGVSVVAVDPAEMDPRLVPFRELRSASPEVFLQHLRVAAGEITRQSLPATVDWLLCDMNLAPTVALGYVERIAAFLRPDLKGVVVTLKLNDERMFRGLPRLIDRAGRLGLGPARVAHLPSHRREVVAIAVNV
jgi:23S rRNA (cytidine2498-2'-O)-methyltransferase